jgi:hypothetical protein
MFQQLLNTIIQELLRRMSKDTVLKICPKTDRPESEVKVTAIEQMEEKRKCRNGATII